MTNKKDKELELLQQNFEKKNAADRKGGRKMKVSGKKVLELKKIIAKKAGQN